VKQQALFRNPDRPRDRSVLRETDKHNLANLIAAEVVLESPEKYGGGGSRDRLLGYNYRQKSRPTSQCGARPMSAEAQTGIPPRPARSREAYALTCYHWRRAVELPVTAVIDTKATCPCVATLVISWRPDARQ